MYATRQVYTSDITTGPKDDPYTVRNAITLNIQINSPDFDQGEVCKRVRELCRAAMQYFESIQMSEERMKKYVLDHIYGGHGGADYRQ